MKKIFIYAYSQLNLGDDLFVKILCDRYPNHQFYTISKKSNSAALRQIPNLTIINVNRYLDYLLKKMSLSFILSNYYARKCDILVNIGGSIFMEPQNWLKNIKDFSKKIIKGKPFFVLGSNFGPYNTNEFYTSYKHQFNKITDICFRDEYSYNLFSNVGNVRMAPDIVFSLNEKLPIRESDNKTIIISVLNLKNRKTLAPFQADYENKLIETAILLIKEGYYINLMGFCLREGDQETINTILNNIPYKYKSYVRSYAYEGDLYDALIELKSANGIIATRFHSMILGWLFKYPVYPMIYSSKMLNVIKDTSFSGEYSLIEEVVKTNPTEIVLQLINGKKHNIDNLIEKSNDHFYKLDEYLK